MRQAWQDEREKPEELQCLTCQHSSKSMTVQHIHKVSGFSVYDLIEDVTLKPDSKPSKPFSSAPDLGGRTVN